MNPRYFFDKLKDLSINFEEFDSETNTVTRVNGEVFTHTRYSLNCEVKPVEVTSYQTLEKTEGKKLVTLTNIKLRISYSQDTETFNTITVFCSDNSWSTRKVINKVTPQRLDKWLDKLKVLQEEI